MPPGPRGPSHKNVTRTADRPEQESNLLPGEACLCPRMGRGTLIFSLLFLALPLLALLLVWIAGLGLTMTVAALALLILGFTLWIPAMDPA